MKKKTIIAFAISSITSVTLFVGCAQKDEALHQKATELESARQELEATVNSLETKLADLEANIKVLSDKEPETEKRIDGVKKSISNLERIDNRIMSQISNLESEIYYKTQLTQIKGLYPEALSTESGLHYIVVKEGEGETNPAKGNSIKAHYTGTLLDGSEFDSSHKRNQPFEFEVGLGRVIKGWDEAFLAMKKGEQRKLIIPSKLGYGGREIPGAIPANSILVFDVELIEWTD